VVGVRTGVAVMAVVALVEFLDDLLGFLAGLEADQGVDLRLRAVVVLLG
jgi:hypothetical protein